MYRSYRLDMQVGALDVCVCVCLCVCMCVCVHIVYIYRSYRLAMQVGALDVKLREVLSMNYSELNVQFMKALSEYEDAEARSGCLTKQQFKEMLIRIFFLVFFSRK